MKTKLRIATALCSFLFYFNCQAQWQWVSTQKLQNGLPGESHSHSIATSDIGNSYSTGDFTDTLFLKNFPLGSGGFKCPFIVKHNINGDVVWATRMRITGVANSFGTGNGISLDNLENIYTIGDYKGTMNLDNLQLTGGGVYIAKYKSGVANWAKKITSNLSITGRGITTDIAANIIITGTFTGTAVFDNVSLVSQGKSDIFIAKYNSEGTLLWARKAGGVNVDEGNAVTTDASGNIFLTGKIGAGSCGFNPLLVDNSICNPINNPFNPPCSFFITKYDKNGVALWVSITKTKNCASPKAVGYAIATDKNGDCYCTGAYSNNVLFGNLFCSNSQNSYFDDIFIVKYSGTSGTPQWLQAPKGDFSVGMEPDDYGTGIIMDKSTGIVLVTGVNKSEVEFAPNILHTSPDDAGNIWVAAYNQNGVFQWLNQAYSSADDVNVSSGIATDKNGSYYLTGSFDEEMFFDNSNVFIPLTSIASSFFVAKYHIPFVPRSVITQQTSSNSKQDAFNIHLYPNPAQDDIMIEAFIPNKTSINIQITNALGAIQSARKQENVSGNYQCKINIKDYPTGVYYIRITTADGTKRTTKFIKQ